MDLLGVNQKTRTADQPRHRLLPFAAGMAIGGASGYMFGTSENSKKTGKVFLNTENLLGILEVKIMQCVEAASDGSMVNKNVLNQILRSTFAYFSEQGATRMNADDVNLLMHYGIIERTNAYDEIKARDFINRINFQP